MRSLLLAALLWGQERYELIHKPLAFPKECRAVGNSPLVTCTVAEAFLLHTPDHTRVREWLRPNLTITQGSCTDTPGACYDIGPRQRVWGDERWANTYLDAPMSAVYIRASNGKWVKITRAEIERRAR